MLETIGVIIVVGFIIIALFDVIIYITVKIKEKMIKKGEDKFNERLKETSALIQNEKNKKSESMKKESEIIDI